MKGKQNNTSFGETTEDGGILHDAQSQDRCNRDRSGYLKGCGNGCSRDSELSEHFIQRLESNGFNQTIVWLTSASMKYKCWILAYYPSTPASNALRLSSRVDIPVRAKIRVLFLLGFDDSILRISFAAPTPSSSGIDISRRTILINVRSSVGGRERHADQQLTRIDPQSRTFVRHHVRQRLQLYRIPDPREQD